MKLYDYPGAPNPRKVKIFAAEKGIELGLARVELLRGAHKTPEFLRKNPSGKIPVLELDDGRCIAESVAICRYLEAVQPKPNLFGRDAYELGFIEARNRQIELELGREIATSWLHGPVVAKTGLVKSIPEAKVASDAATHRYYDRLDKELADSAYVAGNRFTVADIILVTAVDFAAEMVGLKPEASLVNLYRWHAEVSARPSCEYADSAVAA